MLQLLVCDWLLEIRWSLYEIDKNLLHDDQYFSVPLETLSKFQNDLNSLRVIVQDMPVSRVSCKHDPEIYDTILMTGMALPFICL